MTILPNSDLLSLVLDELRNIVRRLSIAALVATASQWRPGTCPDTPLAATRYAMKSIALRYKQLSGEILTLDVQLDRLVAEAAPSLLALRADDASSPNPKPSMLVTL